jgi:hypothetical protein
LGDLFQHDATGFFDLIELFPGIPVEGVVESE